MRKLKLHNVYGKPIGKVVEVNEDTKKVTIELNEPETPYGRISTRGFIPLKQYRELVHTTRLEF